MSETTQARRARVTAEMGTPPTVAEQTAAREANNAASIAETKTNRAAHEAVKRNAEEWPLRKANYPEDQR